MSFPPRPVPHSPLFCLIIIIAPLAILSLSCCALDGQQQDIEKGARLNERGEPAELYNFLSAECAFFASIQMSMLRESYIRRRQLQREQLSRLILPTSLHATFSPVLLSSKIPASSSSLSIYLCIITNSHTHSLTTEIHPTRSRKFNGQVKIWVMELKDIDLTHSLGPFFNGNLNLTVRVSLEGQVRGDKLQKRKKKPKKTQKHNLASRLSLISVMRTPRTSHYLHVSLSNLNRQMKGTTKSTPARAGRGFEPLKISQDVDFYVKRPTSIVHMEILHINEDQPDNSMTREVLIGQVLMNLQPLESQKTIRQWFPCLVNGAVSASIQLRMNYTFKEDVLQKWDPDSGLARSDEHGGANFTIGFIGVGQIGQCALDAVLKSCNLHPSRVHVSTRRPETLYNYSQIGVNVCFDNALVASTVDILFIAVQPNHLTQLVSVIRGKIRQETLVVSLIAGVGSERMCNLLQVPCVFRCSIGGEWGLPEPDPKEYQLRCACLVLLPQYARLPCVAEASARTGYFPLAVEFLRAR